MKTGEIVPRGYTYPSTRYSGSKRRLLEWIWEHVRDIKFTSVLDVFGGTGSVSLLFKRHGKCVHYNDLLQFNQVIGRAIIENNNIIVNQDDIRNILTFQSDNYPKFIQQQFRGKYFLDKENAWLDKAITNIRQISNPYKRSILLAALFQACLAKRPYNLFHRANLYMRKARVLRTFRNKTTWERPFPELVNRYVIEYNKAVFSNGKENRVIGGFDALNAPNGVDLVYLDPPYVSSNSGNGVNYLRYYHFLEGLVDYDNWSIRIDYSDNKTKHITDMEANLRFSRKSDITLSLSMLLERFQDNIIVLSYRSDGIPSRDEINTMLHQYNKHVKVYEYTHNYALSRGKKSELLFVAK